MAKLRMVLAALIVFAAMAAAQPAFAQAEPILGPVFDNNGCPVDGSQAAADCKAASERFQVAEFIEACAPCTIVQTFFDLAVKMGSGFFQEVEKYHFVEVFGGLFTFLFVLWRLGVLFSPFGSFNGAEFWHGIWKTLAWYAVVVTVAQVGGFDWFWGNIVDPVTNVFAGLGMSVMQLGGTAQVACQSFGTSGLSAATEQNLLCFVSQMNGAAGAGIVYAARDISEFSSFSVFSAPGIVVAGILLLVAFTALYVLFVLSFAEVVFRLVAPAVLFPMALVAYIFPAWRSFARAAIGMLLHAFFYLLLMGIIFALAVQLMLQALQKAPGAANANLSTVTSIIQYFSSGPDIKPISIVDGSFWLMMVIAILTSMLLRQASSIASAMVQYSDGLSGTTGHALGALAAGMSLGGTAAGGLGRQVARGVRNMFKPQ